MPDPLSEDFAAILRSDSTAALAALLVITDAHRDLTIWVSRTVFGAAHKRNRRRNGDGRKDDRRLSRRDDGALVEAMRDTPTASIGELAEAIGKSRTSTVSALQRLRTVGLAVSDGKTWRLTEEPPPRPPVERWLHPPVVRKHSTAIHPEGA
jgi:hypothetical protein